MDRVRISACRPWFAAAAFVWALQGQPAGALAVSGGATPAPATGEERGRSSPQPATASFVAGLGAPRLPGAGWAVALPLRPGAAGIGQAALFPLAADPGAAVSGALPSPTRSASLGGQAGRSGSGGTRQGGGRPAAPAAPSTASASFNPAAASPWESALAGLGIAVYLAARRRRGLTRWLPS